MAHIDSLYINYQIPGQDFNDHENWAILVSDKDSILYKGFEPTPLQNDNFIHYCPVKAGKSVFEIVET